MAEVVSFWQYGEAGIIAETDMRGTSLIANSFPRFCRWFPRALARPSSTRRTVIVRRRGGRFVAFQDLWCQCRSNSVIGRPQAIRLGTDSSNTSRLRRPPGARDEADACKASLTAKTSIGKP